MKIKVKKSGAGRDFSGAMTDISFLLIIFFLVTSVFLSTKGILIKLPNSETEPRRLHPNEVISVEIISKGEYKIEETTVGKDKLAPLITHYAATLQEPILVLGVGTDILYDEVIQILEIAKENGASSFSIRYQESEPRGLKIGEESL